MHILLNFIAISLSAHFSLAQLNPEIYPDPRIDPFNCKIATVAPVCDPSELLTYGEKEALAARINQLLTYAATVPNTSPSCQLFPTKRLEIIIAVIDKIGTPNAPTDIEEFANNLKIRYQLYQNANFCDLMVLIVNSNQDRQVFTVAGKDTKLTKKVLKSAFEQNINHFRANNYAIGLQGMAEFITNSYREAQLSQPNAPVLTVPMSPANEMVAGRNERVDNLVGSVPQRLFHSKHLEVDGAATKTFGKETVPIQDKSDQLWIGILSQAMARCGEDRDKMDKYVQAVVEEAMSLSLQLISDQRYLTIEERMQSMQNNPESRSKIWNEAKATFIDQLYHNYLTTIRSKANTCPAMSETARIFSKH